MMPSLSMMSSPTTALSSLLWLVLCIIALLATVFVALLPAYTILLAGITILRAKWRRGGGGGKSKNNSDVNVSVNGSGSGNDALSPWSGITTSLFQGSVSHIRHQPVVHAFTYPLYFAVVDLDEASELFGGENVRPEPLEPSSSGQQVVNEKSKEARKGDLWPLSSLMLLRDVDHLKNGEGLSPKTSSPSSDPAEDEETNNNSLSTRERLSNLVFERTNGKLDLRSTTTTATNKERRKILLVTHLMYYGYCFNPVSFYFILKPNNNTSSKNDDDNGNEEKEEHEQHENEKEDIIEAVVVEISNTPWNEMSVYVLHPDSIDTVEHSIVDSRIPDFQPHIYGYKMQKKFHVSPFMTMDHDYDWKFQVSGDCIKVQAQMIKRPSDENDTTNNDDDDRDEKRKGQLYFTAKFDIQRTIQPTSTTYPFQLAKVISRFPIYCFIIQLWIHYEAIKLLMKGVEFVPHPDGSETGASKAIAAVMRPVFAAMDVVDAWWSGGGKEKGKSKSA